MKLKGIPLLQSEWDELGMRPCAQAIMQLKELVPDKVRYEEYKAWLKMPRKRKELNEIHNRSKR